MSDLVRRLSRITGQADAERLEAAAEIERLRAERDALKQTLHDELDANLRLRAEAQQRAMDYIYLDTQATMLRAEIERDTALLRQALAALAQWDALIQHQYSSTRAGMNDMHNAAQGGARAIEALQERLGEKP